jgi:hypothetical protein
MWTRLLPLLALLLATPLPSPSPGPPAEYQAEQAEGLNANTQAGAGEAVEFATVEKAVPSPELHNPPCDHARYADSKEPWYRTPDGLLAAFTLVLAVATGVLATFTWQLVAVTRDTHKVAEGIAETAKESAALSAANLQASQQMFAREQRPWIVPTGVVTLGEPPFGIVVESFLPLHVELKNVGKSPAFHLEIRMTWRPAFRHAESPNPITSLSKPVEYLGPGEYQTLGALAPGATHQHFLMSRQIDRKTFDCLKVSTPSGMGAILWRYMAELITDRAPTAWISPPTSVLSWSG